MPDTSGPYLVPAIHDDGRRVLVGPVRTEAGVRRVTADIGSLGWHPGTPMHRMTHQAWFAMAYHEKKAATEAEQEGQSDARQ